MKASIERNAAGGLEMYVFAESGLESIALKAWSAQAVELPNGVRSMPTRFLFTILTPINKTDD